MVMSSKCPFCEQTYGDAEEHKCDEWKRETAEKTKELRENLGRWLYTNGKFVPYKDDN